MLKLTRMLTPSILTIVIVIIVNIVMNSTADYVVDFFNWNDYSNVNKITTYTAYFVTGLGLIQTFRFAREFNLSKLRIIVFILNAIVIVVLISQISKGLQLLK